MKMFICFTKNVAPEIINLAITDPENKYFRGLDWDEQLEIMTLAEVCLSEKLNPYINADYRTACTSAESIISSSLESLFYEDIVENYIQDSIRILKGEE